jgi:hypothetical protein
MFLLLSEEAMRIKEDNPQRMVKNEWIYDCVLKIINRKKSGMGPPIFCIF